MCTFSDLFYFHAFIYRVSDDVRAMGSHPVIEAEEQRFCRGICTELIAGKEIRDQYKC
jgi:hypothetical protein